MRPRLQNLALLAALIAIVTTVAAGLSWDNQREADAALAEVAANEALLARAIARAFEARLSVPDATEAEARAEIAPLEHSGELLVLLAPANASGWTRTDGSPIAAPALTEAAMSHASSLRLSRPDAKALGLPSRAAFAGFSSVSTLGHEPLVIAVVATAWRERDREIRASWRLVFGTFGAAGLASALGGFALRERAREERLARELLAASLGKEADERLARAAKAAMLGTLSSGIAHEVATPLGIISGRAEQLAKRVADDPRGAHAAQVIIEQVERIHETIRGFLGLARGIAPALSASPPDALVDEAIGLVEHRFREAKVVLMKEVGTTKAVAVNARLFTHALTNLLLNACDASPASGRVTMRVEARDDGAAFIVEDEGSGIDEQDAARVLEPFFTTKAEGRGTGLGLAIAAEIAKIHRGSLHIEARAPKGTRVVIEVPATTEIA